MAFDHTCQRHERLNDAPADAEIAEFLAKRRARPDASQSSKNSVGRLKANCIRSLDCPENWYICRCAAVD
jgi:hypothetical protein